ncbi:hypothetical protein PPERSA_08442 [Pseudocohnilembus persalinus]|uniref:V-SNARE coiled-coil homology domain-containing protein n=1 Tax=Pseudocohnilembus persalinus TaxID=266149 RepID=A0A0V0R6D0_PSEPJ|nr:hypothetical protein PPERSA_08442 [Pseudocohnilembus persalinus]|eukprot:KRX10039.1 hypothetical protein PPERSA_08442 [Pseudocohnilembus persalinus]
MIGEEIRASAVIYRENIIFYECLQIPNKELIKKEVNNLQNNTLSYVTRKNKTQKTTTQFGVWYYLQDDAGFIYLVLASVNYQFPQVQNLLDDIKRRVNKQTSLTQSVKNEIYNQLRYYDSNPGSDILLTTQESMKNASNVMRDNLNQALGNKGQMEDIELKSSDLHNMSVQFSRDSHKLQQKMKLRMIKQRIMLFGILLLAIIAFYFFFISGDSEENGKDEQNQNNNVQNQGDQNQQVVDGNRRLLSWLFNNFNN